jgi:hypothetical protein
VGLLRLVPFGFFAAAYGTLIGAGGGFVLAPALLLLYPEEPPETVASILRVVSNVLLATLAYSRSVESISSSVGSLPSPPFQARLAARSRRSFPGASAAIGLCGALPLCWG